MCCSGFHIEHVETETVEMYSRGDKYGSSVFGHVGGHWWRLDDEAVKIEKTNLQVWIRS